MPTYQSTMQCLVSRAYQWYTWLHLVFTALKVLSRQMGHTSSGNSSRRTSRNFRSMCCRELTAFSIAGRLCRSQTVMTAMKVSLASFTSERLPCRNCRCEQARNWGQREGYRYEQFVDYDEHLEDDRRPSQALQSHYLVQAAEHLA